MNIMKNRLVNLFKKSRERYMSQRKYASKNYDDAYQHWQKSIENEEKLILSKDALTYRDTFEKTFPELRKAREDKEKKLCVHNTSNESTNTLNDQQQSSSLLSTLSITGNEQAVREHDMDDDDDKMRRSSIVPPMLYDRWQRKHQYYNQNGLVKDECCQFYREHSKMPIWSAEEKQIFIEKFTQAPKNFGYISLHIENKTIEQCVQFYYLTKKTANYKNLLRKQTQANRRRAKQNTTTTLTTTTVTSSTTIKTTLVTKVTSSNTIVSSTSQKILGSDNSTGQVRRFCVCTSIANVSCVEFL
jgi:nuclear receptor co-repressor 1